MSVPTLGKIRLNHVAMSVPPDLLDAEHRRDLTRFYEEVFGFTEHESMTEDGQRLVFQVHEVNQFMFLYGSREAMQCPRMDHWGIQVDTEEELDEILRRAKAFQEKDPRVHIVDKHTDDYTNLAITATYIGYLLPMTIEIQWWQYKGVPAAQGAG
jgi:hypothetical protein